MRGEILVAACCGLLLSACGSREGLAVEQMGEAAALDAGPVRNACGGEARLSAGLNDPCGCGVWQCDGPEALACIGDGPVNACGECGAEPLEECNGRDSNCDGRIDEGCVRVVAPLRANATRVRISAGQALLSVEWTTRAGDMALVDLATGELEVLTPREGDINSRGDVTREYGGVLDGELLAWLVDIDRHETEIVGRYRGVPFHIPGLGAVTDLAADAGRLVFVAWSPRGGRVVWMFDADSGALTELTDRGPEYEFHEAPDLSGDWLVYVTQYRHTEGNQVWALNLRDGREVEVSRGIPGWHLSPAIDGELIVWQHNDVFESSPARSHGSIYSYDLNTNEGLPVTWRDSARPRVAGDLVCWTSTERRVGTLELSTRARQTLGHGAAGCDVSREGLVAWREVRGGSDAYYFDMGDGTPRR